MEILRHLKMAPRASGVNCIRALPRSLKISHISMMAASAITLRVLKNWGLGPIQFINIPLAFGFIASYFYGSFAGALVAAISHSISDLMIFPGPWTIINSLLMAIIAMGGSLIRGGELFELIYLYLLVFTYDILSSIIGWIILGMNLINALLLSIIGLFIPAGGGWLIMVGPITEIITSISSLSLIKVLKRLGLVRGSQLKSG